MRPHFDIPLGDEGSGVFASIRKSLAAPGAIFIGDVLATHAYLRVPRDKRSLLSPNLNLQLVEEGGEVILRGRFTPHPSVWMGFMAVFFTLGLIGLGGLMYGLAQLTVDETPWALAATPICLGLIAFVYGAAFVGQGLVQEEMYAMRAWVEDLAGARSRLGGPAHRAQAAP
jgi:hypothetical protein